MGKQNFNITFGEFIKSKRLEKGWTQLDLASRIGNNFQNVSSLERGTFGPTLFWCVEVLAPAFDMDFKEFYDEYDSYMESYGRKDG